MVSSSVVTLKKVSLTGGISDGVRVGAKVGTSVGISDGVRVGAKVGTSVGISDGVRVGAKVGTSVGISDEVRVGAKVGTSVGIYCRSVFVMAVILTIVRFDQPVSTAVFSVVNRLIGNVGKLAFFNVSPVTCCSFVN